MVGAVIGPFTASHPHQTPLALTTKQRIPICLNEDGILAPTDG